MKKHLLLLLFVFVYSISFSQNSRTAPSKTAPSTTITLDPAKVAIFEKYMEFRYTYITGGLTQWKQDNPDLYLKEMWYFGQSFYIQRDYFHTGLLLDEGMIYIPRFEDQRKENEEAIVTFEGFKDVMVLLPNNKLIYKVN